MKIICQNSLYGMLLLFSAAVNGQNMLEEKITLSTNRETIGFFIKEITEQTGYTFSYVNNEIPLEKVISLPANSGKVREILDAIARDLKIKYEVRNKKILLTGKDKKQRHTTINGYIKDKETGETLIGANIWHINTFEGATSNVYGFYSLTLPGDSLHLVFSYVGYEPMGIKFLLHSDTTINVNLSPQIHDVIVINAHESSHIQDVTQMSSFDLPLSQLKALPAIAGETDIMKGLQLLPGVRAGDEGTSGLYVRGGGPDQNLILLDGVPVYNASHLFGFFSVFNADAINHVELIKGGFPARFGGRLSSVIDIRMKEGNKQKIKGEGSVGLIASKLTLEGPLIKDKASFIFSGRRTYIDLLARPILKAISGSGQTYGYYFYDINSKLNFTINAKNRLYLSAYSGSDKGYGISDISWQDSDQTVKTHATAGLGWGNLTSALRWNCVLNPKLFSNVAATFSKYNFRIQSESETAVSVASQPVNYNKIGSFYSSGIDDYSVKADFDFIASPTHYIKFGSYGIHHTFKPGATTHKSSTYNEDIQFNAGLIRAIEFGSYIEDDFDITPQIKINAGAHFSGFRVSDKTFHSLQPRASVRFLLNEKFSIKSSYTFMTQYIHLLTNSGIGLPTDLWVPATPKIKPQKSRQFAIGVAYKPEGNYELTLEGYSKDMDGVLEYAEGAGYLNNTTGDWQTKVETGKAESYGSEFFLHKKLGAWKGWLGYTLSWTYRQFDQLNFGKKFPYRYDRRHDIELTVSHARNKRIEFSGTWVYGTGNAITLPVAVYSSSWIFLENNLYYDGKNGYRMRPYHRMDLSLSFKKVKKWGERAWVISLYNAYSRQNTFYVDYGYDYSGRNGLGEKLLQYSLFPIIPSITYNFKF